MHGIEHEITERRSPINIQLRCSCGWVRQITRRQNALARAAKVRSAINEHYRAVAEEPQDAEPAKYNSSPT